MHSMETRIVQIEADVKHLQEALTAFQGEIRELRIELKAANDLSRRIDKQTSLNEVELRSEISVVRTKLDQESAAAEENIEYLCTSLRSVNASVRGLQHGTELFRQELRYLDGRVDAIRNARQ